MRRGDIKPLPPATDLHRQFAYDPATGRLTWKVRPHPQAKRSAPGTEAGTITKGRSKYLAVGIGRRYYKAHRIIWKMVTGADPLDQIDHRDRDRLNNRWENLRPATNGSNLWNSKLRADNSSGFKGVVNVWNGKPGHKKVWRAIITVNGQTLNLGGFETPEEASAARASAAQKLHGEFARAK